MSNPIRFEDFDLLTREVFDRARKGEVIEVELIDLQGEATVRLDFQEPSAEGIVQGDCLDNTEKPTEMLRTAIWNAAYGMPHALERENKETRKTETLYVRLNRFDELKAA